MKEMMKRTTEADIQELVDFKVAENLKLEYKDSRALQRTDRCKDELSKDVSAFANSAGGTIIYGVQEKPRSIPKGLTRVSIPRRPPPNG